MSYTFITACILFPLTGYNIISLILFKLIGIMYDKFGYRIYGLLIFSIILIISNLLLLMIYPILPLILLGLAYALFAISIW